MTTKPKLPKVAGYQLLKPVGGGGFSTVYRAVNIESRCSAACKVVALTDKTTRDERKALEREMRIHGALKHRNVLEFLGAYVVEPGSGSSYFSAVYMLLEYAAGGDLFDKIAPDVGVGEDIARYYFAQLAAGVHFIHSEGVCHRDLKPENILLDAAGTLKISDFGLSSVFRLNGSGRTRLLTERCGSLPYVAPEIGICEPYEAEPIDIWGIGVILFTLLAGNTPWDEPTKQSYEYCRYLTGQIFDEEPWNRFGRDVLELITGMLTPIPSKRYTMRDIFRHPWMQRPSQIENSGPVAIADRLTEKLREAGDLDIADPSLSSHPSFPPLPDGDGDELIFTAAKPTQFTQTLLLFSQTQSGRRYTPSLTRFYAKLGPGILMPLICEALDELGVKHTEPETSSGVTRVRVAGTDKRKVQFKGSVELEDFERDDVQGSFCIMVRDSGNPISWRQLWKNIILSPAVEPHVYRKR